MVKGEYRLGTQEDLCFTLGLYINLVTFVQFANNICQGTFLASLDTLICYGLLFFFTAKSLFRIVKGITLDMVFLVVIVGFSFVLTNLFSPENITMAIGWPKGFMNHLFFQYFYLAFFAFFVARNITDFDVLEKYMVRFSMVSICMSIFNGFIKPLENLEYMAYSYNMLSQVVVLFTCGYARKKKSYILMAILGCFAIFLLGSRGALVMLIANLIIYILFFQKNIKNILVSIFALLIVGIVGVLLFDEIILFLIDICDMLNIESRTLSKILEQNFLNTSGRNTIYDTAIANLSLLPQGLYSEYSILDGSYTHNIFLELLLYYGLAGGTALFALVTYLVISIIRSKDKNYKKVGIWFLGVGFLKFFVSSSIFRQEPMFYILMGFAAAHHMKKKQNYYTYEKVENSEESNKEIIN